MTKKDQKLEALYHYFLSNGFDHTIEEIAQGIGVTKKTLFNRYENREGMENGVIGYWHQVILSKFYDKCQFCNNTIEKIVLFACELKLSYYNEPSFFTKNFTQKPITINSVFSKALYEIIEEGIQTNCIDDETDVNIYIPYFFHNIIDYFLLLKGEEQAIVLQYLIQPILTSRGVEMIQEIELENLVG